MGCGSSLVMLVADEQNIKNESRQTTTNASMNDAGKKSAMTSGDGLSTMKVKQVTCRSERYRLVWEKPFPVNGQGTLVFHKDTEIPFLISVEDKEGDYRLSLWIKKDQVVFIKNTKGGEEEELTILNGKGCGLENRLISYWYSYDRDNLVLKYGKGYRMEETTFLTYDFLKNVSSSEDKENIRKKLYPYFNAEEKRLIRMYEAMMNSLKGGDITVTEQIVEFDKNPFILNVSPLVLDSTKVNLFFLDEGNFTFSASLSPACRELYENVKGCHLNYPEEVTGFLLSDAIRYSIDTEGCLLNQKLKEKVQKFVGSNKEATYMRITLRSSLGKSPGIPYVLEIWPQGHYSPIHNHGNANAVIKVLLARSTL